MIDTDYDSFVNLLLLGCFKFFEGFGPLMRLTDAFRQKTLGMLVAVGILALAACTDQPQPTLPAAARTQVSPPAVSTQTPPASTPKAEAAVPALPTMTPVTTTIAVARQAQ